MCDAIAADVAALNLFVYVSVATATAVATKTGIFTCFARATEAAVMFSAAVKDTLAATIWALNSAVEPSEVIAAVVLCSMDDIDAFHNQKALWVFSFCGDSLLPASIQIVLLRSHALFE